jgi:RNA-directed DNA polymerase
MAAELGVLLTRNHYLLAKSPYAVVVYADDLVVFGKTQEACEIAKQKINTWLAKRGLALSQEKTRIVHLEEGFDFLGFNIKKYATKRTKRGSILLIKPSKESVKTFRHKVRKTWIKVLGWRTNDAIRYLNKQIIGWGNYFKKKCC